jgi:hypothetical protein
MWLLLSDFNKWQKYLEKDKSWRKFGKRQNFLFLCGKRQRYLTLKQADAHN